MTPQGNFWKSILFVASMATVAAAETISFEAFDAPAAQSFALSFAAFDFPAGSAIDLASFDLPDQPSERDVSGTVENSRPAQAAAERLRVTIYSPTDFYCAPCQRVERECGTGDSEVSVKVEKRPLAAMPARVQRAGQTVGYPVIEFADGTLVCGARSFVELKRLAREHSARDLEPGR
jgi:hypothetical protein